MSHAKPQRNGVHASVHYLGKDDCLGRSNTRSAQRVTALIEREDDGYVSLCPELDIASQGAMIEEARINVQEAVVLFLNTANQTEIEEHFHLDVY